jgi:hypothetical protein
MPTIVETTIFTLDELEALGDARAVERALDWMTGAWGDDTVERTTEALDQVLDDLCGTTGRERGLRQGPITWSAWERYRPMVELAYDFGPDDLTAGFHEGHPLCGLSDLPEGVMRVTRGRYESSITMVLDDEGFHAEVTPSVESAVEDWISDLRGRLVQVVVEEYDYSTSREYLLEMAQANGYTFTSEGVRFG